MRLASTQLVGHVGADAEVRDVAGTAMTTFPLAVQAYKRDDKPTWYRCQWWGKLGERLARHIQKGRPVFLEGEVSLAVWEKDGRTQAGLDIRVEKLVFLPSKQ